MLFALLVVIITALTSIEADACAPNAQGKNQITFYRIDRVLKTGKKHKKYYENTKEVLDIAQAASQEHTFVMQLNQTHLCCIKSPNAFQNHAKAPTHAKKIMRHLDDLQNLILASQIDETAEVEGKLKKEIADADEAAAQLAAKKAACQAQLKALPGAKNASLKTDD